MLGDIKRAVSDGFDRLVETTSPPLLKHVTNPLTNERGHRGKDMPLVTWDLVDGADYVDITCQPKALGSGRWAALVSPKGGLVLGPWARTEFYLNAGTGFHSNDARGTTATVNPDPRDPGFGGALEKAPPLVRSWPSTISVPAWGPVRKTYL